MEKVLEIRSLPGEVRAAAGEDGKPPRLEGTGVRWMSLSEDLGGFRERFVQGAFLKSIEAEDPKVIWQHDKKCVFGRVRRGTAQIWEDEEGLRYSAEPPDAVWARDAMESIRRGDVDQNSFGFLVPKGGDRWEKQDGEVIRTVFLAHLVEVGPQTSPAYADTTVALRSLQSLDLGLLRGGTDRRRRELDLTMEVARGRGIL